MLRNRYFVIISLFAALLAALGAWLPGQRATAQDANLLANASLERPYYGQGAPTRTAPQGWNLWVGAGAPDALPQNERTRVRDGEVSWHIRQGGAAFTAAAFQRVEGVTPGETLRAQAYAWLFTCDNTQTGCATSQPPYVQSDRAAGAVVRIGIDPTGGTDPASAAIVWSADSSPYDGWSALTVATTAGGDAVTVFLYMSQAAGLALNEVFLDQASLVRASDLSAEPVQEVPFVVPQGVRPDGSIVHVVQEGDTLSSIAFAYFDDYGTTLASIAELNNLKTHTRFLTIGQEIVILPPGSVDPQTGRRLEPGQRVTTVPTGAAIDEPAEVSTAAATPGPTEEPTEEPTEDIEAGPTVAADTQPLPGPGGAAAAAVPTDEPAEEPTEEPTPQPTEEPTQEPTEEPEPTAPAVAAAPELLATDGTLCITVYRDDDMNGRQDAAESILTGGQVVTAQPGSVENMVDYVKGPLCMDLEPGWYDVRAILPAGFGSTTVDSMTVRLASGRQVDIAFGGAEGYAPPAIPEGEVSDQAVEAVPPGAVAPMVEMPVETDGDRSTLDKLYDNSGLIVLAAAGIFAVGSALGLLLTRRS